MLVGVPKEIKNQESRVGLTPASVKELVLRGHQVLVQQDAGAAIQRQRWRIVEDREIAAAGLDGVRMLLQVHDELVFEVPESREEDAAQVIRGVMSGAAEPAISLDVPLDIDVGWGINWGAAH